jgi:hypothetical protein
VAAQSEEIWPWSSERCRPDLRGRGNMAIRIATLCLLVLVSGVGLTAAENPFAGTWKLNPAKSKFTGDTMKFAQTPSGRVRFSASGLSYTFKTDGKEYPGPVGDLVSWKQVDDHTWQTTYKLKGTLISTDTSTLSSDGKTMTVISRGTRPNGQSFEDTTLYERISGNAGLLGKWKDKEVKISAPFTLHIASAGVDGLAFTFVDFKATCKARFDEKDHPVTGPTVPPGLSLTLKRTGPRSLELLSKQHGKPLFKNIYTLSDDGHTLTAAGRPVAVDEPYTFVYERE